MVAKFTPPDYFGELPQLAQDILRKSFSQVADVLAQPAISLAVETVEAILVAGPPQRVSPTSVGMRAILPAPGSQNSGETFSLLIEDPLGSVIVTALPHRDPGGKERATTINGATTATFSVAGQVSFVSNGIDRYVSSAPAVETAAGNATPLPGTTFAANTTGGTRVANNLTHRSDNSIPARIAGRLVELVASASGVLRRSTTGALDFGLVDTDNLEDAAITEPKLATDSVSSDKILADAVTTVKIADENVTIAKQAHVAEHVIRGRFTTGTGDLQDKTVAGFFVSGFTYVAGVTGELSVDFSSVTYTASTGNTLVGLDIQNAIGETTNTHLADVPANSIKCRPSGSVGNPADLEIGGNSFIARVGGALTSHDFITFAGAGLDYAAGVLSVDFSSVTYAADETTLTLSALQFSIKALGVDTAQLALNSVGNAQASNMAGNTVKLRSNGATGDAEDFAMPPRSVLGRGASGDITPFQSNAPDDVLHRESGGNIVWGRLKTGNIDNNQITAVKTDLTDDFVWTGDQVNDGVTAKSNQSTRTEVGVQTNYTAGGTLSSTGVIRWTGASALTLDSMVAARDGQIVHVFNCSSGQTITVRDESASTGTATNQFRLEDGSNRTIPQDGCASFWYDGDSNRWRLLNASISGAS